MRGLELARAYYEEYGRPMIEEQFPAYAGRIAVGLAGEGSECFGYDDQYSRDHDFEAGFCLWLTREDGEAIGFPLFRAYGKLPAEYRGVKKRNPASLGAAARASWRSPSFTGG